MAHRSIPIWLRHAPTPSINGFAMLAGIESFTRGFMISVFPVALYLAFGSKQLVTTIYFWGGVVGLVAGLLVPYFNRFVPRRWLYILGLSFYIWAGLAAIFAGANGLIIAFFLQLIATATVFVSFNAYLLDYIERISLGRAETRRLFYSAFGWTLGPWLSVRLFGINPHYPFYITIMLSLAQIVLFIRLRFGDGKQFRPAIRAASNPLGYLSRFFAQPRLIAGWLFAVIRSCGWWVYVVYVPIYAIDKGFKEDVGALMLSLANLTLFVTPYFNRILERSSVRRAVRAGFFLAGSFFLLSIVGVFDPILALISLYFGSICMIFLDLCAGLPFLMAVRPSERAQMSAVYSSFRDVSGILTPGIAWLLLLVMPMPGIFVAMGLGHWIAFMIADTLPQKLGKPRGTQNGTKTVTDHP